MSSNTTPYKYPVIALIGCLACSALAETVYVIDKFNIGLHRDRSIDSPITTLVPSGTELKVLRRESGLLQVTGPRGASGWVNSEYIINQKPGRVRIAALETENDRLKEELKTLKTQAAGAEHVAPPARPDDQKRLEQLLNSERLKAGELQVRLTDLKARIADIDDPADYVAEIERLKQENNQLISQLESSGLEVQAYSYYHNGGLPVDNWKKALFFILIIFIIGMVGGACLLDHINCKRHGGFRL